MSKFINVTATAEQILAVPDVQFKLLKRDEEKDITILSTPIGDDFSRGLLSIEPDKISIGIQAPDKEGKITLVYQPLASEILELVVFQEELVEQV